MANKMDLDCYGIPVTVEYLIDGMDTEIDTVYVNDIDIGMLIGQEQFEELNRLLIIALIQKAKEEKADFADWCYHQWKNEGIYTRRR